MRGIRRCRDTGLDEQAVMFAFNLIDRITDGAKEDLIRGANRPIQFEFDHGLRLSYSRHLALVVRRPRLLRGDVGRILDDLEGSAVAVQDRVVRGLQPDLPAALADAPVLTRLVFAAPELGPECAIVA